MDNKTTMADNVVVSFCEGTGQLFQPKPFCPVIYLLSPKPSNIKDWASLSWLYRQVGILHIYHGKTQLSNKHHDLEFERQ